jgi:anhydro-N-acetylmuramic acid kinase
MPLRVLGFMTGTSLDAVDMAVLETDGEAIQAFGPAGERELRPSTRALILDATAAALAWPRGTPAPAVFATAADAVVEAHLQAGGAFLAGHGLEWADLDLIGMHGQTVLHERPQAGRTGRSVQLGDGARLAALTGRPVAFDFRAADVAAGGQGAPLAPLYHLARMRASGLEPPLACLNLGGVANLTLAASDGTVCAFDTGPANGMIDLYVQGRGLGRCDVDGRLAAAGRVDEGALRALTAHPYFAAPPPKSLDRHDFRLEAVEGLSPQDAAATLTAFTAEAVRLGLDQAREAPRALIVCGGGRRNPEIMRALRARCAVEVLAAEDVGWRGDSIEAETFAYLAARTARGLPITLPATTGAPEPLTGGRIADPPGPC